MTTVRMHIGVDVGKEWLDVCYPDGKKEHVKNIKSCRTKLIAKAAKIGAIESFEATGPYEEPLADECLAKGVRAVRLPPCAVSRNLVYYSTIFERGGSRYGRVNPVAS